MLVGATASIVAGRVQGVGFRYFTRDAARLDGLAGTVRNLDDGARGVESKATPRPCCASSGAIRRGPTGSRVDDVRVDESPPSGRFLISAFCRSQPSAPRTRHSMTTTLKTKIRNVPDFPKPGILFYDITTLLRDRRGSAT